MYRNLIEMLDYAENHCPDATAFICRERKTTHGDFAGLSRRIAAGLRASGLTPGDRVAIVMEKSMETVAAMTAVLRSGGAYVPIDRFQPFDRIFYIMGNCACRYAICDDALLEKSKLPDSVEKAFSAADFASCESDGAGFENHAAAPTDLAFILYTSGSTGRPKGVKITHQNLTGFINWSIRKMALKAEDIFSGHANFNFDLSTFDIYASLAVGASTVIFTETEMKNPLLLGELISRFTISIWYSVPSILQLMVSTGSFENARPSNLRCILFAGEVFHGPSLKKLMSIIPGADYYNLYGPTETNVCTFHRVCPEDLEDPGGIPIGRPLPGLRFRIVDEQGADIVDRKSTGELVIYGDCVTPGYWNLEDERNKDLHALGAHATGDLVYIDQERIYYAGRKDQMIKLNGYRIELGEIERVLAEHDAIENVVVVPIQRDGQNRLLICFSPKKNTKPPNIIALKSHCAEKLPVYMIPHQSIVINEMPLNPNGKIDRKAVAARIR